MTESRGRSSTHIKRKYVRLLTDASTYRYRKWRLRLADDIQNHVYNHVLAMLRSLFQVLFIKNVEEAIAELWKIHAVYRHSQRLTKRIDSKRFASVPST